MLNSGRGSQLLTYTDLPGTQVALATYTSFLLFDEKAVLRADAAFTAMMIFGILRFYFISLPAVLSKLVQARVALSRIEQFLDCDDLDDAPDNFVEGTHRFIHQLSE